MIVATVAASIMREIAREKQTPSLNGLAKIQYNGETCINNNNNRHPNRRQSTAETTMSSISNISYTRRQTINEFNFSTMTVGRTGRSLTVGSMWRAWSSLRASTRQWAWWMERSAMGLEVRRSTRAGVLRVCVRPTKTWHACHTTSTSTTKSIIYNSRKSTICERPITFNSPSGEAAPTSSHPMAYAPLIKCSTINKWCSRIIASTGPNNQTINSRSILQWERRIKFLRPKKVK